MHKIAIVIDYFGHFPEYFNFFLESCKWNPSINWIIHSDCKYTGKIPSNVEIKYISWEDYIEKVSKTLSINFQPTVAYKICDLKPAYGVLWHEELKEYTHWGFGDIDLVYGDLSQYYTDDKLSKNDLISVHGWNASGPLCVVKNNDAVLLFGHIPNWRKHFEEPNCVRFDEDIFLRSPCELNGFRLHLEDKHITPLVKGKWAEHKDVVHDETWIWKDGKITSPNNPGKEWVAIHFMNYEKARWLDSSYGEAAPWSKLTKIINVDNPSDGFVISLNGINPLE